jgi:hypothetical protein
MPYFFQSINEKISNVKRERSKYYEEMDVELLHEDIAQGDNTKKPLNRPFATKGN